MSNHFTVTIKDDIQVELMYGAEKFSRMLVYYRKFPDISEEVFEPIAKYLNYLATKPEVNVYMKGIDILPSNSKISKAKSKLLRKYSKKFPFQTPRSNDVIIWEYEDGKFNLHKFINDDFENQLLRELDYTKISEILNIIEDLDFQRMRLLIHEFMFNETKFEELKEILNHSQNITAHKNMLQVISLTTKNFYKFAISLCMKNSLTEDFFDVFEKKGILEMLTNDFKDKFFFTAFTEHLCWTKKSASGVFKEMKKLPSNNFVGFYVICEFFWGLALELPREMHLVFEKIDPCRKNYRKFLEVVYNVCLDKLEEDMRND